MVEKEYASDLPIKSVVAFLAVLSSQKVSKLEMPWAEFKKPPLTTNFASLKAIIASY
jgi:hypothetical protein